MSSRSCSQSLIFGMFARSSRLLRLGLLRLVRAGLGLLLLGLLLLDGSRLARGRRRSSRGGRGGILLALLRRGDSGGRGRSRRGHSDLVVRVILGIVRIVVIVVLGLFGFRVVRVARVGSGYGRGGLEGFGSGGFVSGLAERWGTSMSAKLRRSALSTSNRPGLDSR